MQKNYFLVITFVILVDIEILLENYPSSLKKKEKSDKVVIFSLTMGLMLCLN